MNWLEPLVFRDGRSLPCRLFPGPMDGVTEGSFVRAMSSRRYVRLWHTPFIRISTGVPHLSRLREGLSLFMAQKVPVIAQIMGTIGDHLAGTARRLHELEVTCVDLNCACPSPTVLGSHSGGAHLLRPDWIRETLLKIRSACGNHAFSVKLRIGFDSPEEFPQIAAAVREAQPDIVFLHYRTVREVYRPVPDGWRRFRQARELLPDLRLVGCGDIASIDDARNLAENYQLDGIAAARALLGTPSLLQDIERDFLHLQPTPPEDHLAFLLDIATDSGRRPHANNGFILKLARSMFGQDSEIFQALAACNTIDNSIFWLQNHLPQQQ